VNTQEQIENLEKQVAKLNRLNEEKDEMVIEFSDRLIKVLERVDELEKLVNKQAEIIQRFQGEKPPIKTSRNSDIPPSQDVFRKDRRRSRRVKSNNKQGGQKNHPGNFLKFTTSPDYYFDHTLDNCLACNKKLNKNHAILRASRQVIDFPPPPKPLTYQHNVYDILCSCGCLNQTEFPKDVNSSVQYGPRIRSLINYLSVRQYVPFLRMTEMLKDCFNLEISPGTITNTLRRTAKKSELVYQQIKEKIENSKVVGSDETYLFVNGIKRVLWTWQTPNYTYLKITKTRGAKHIKEEFPNGFPKAILCSDQYKAQLNTPSLAHQSCLAHIDRKLIYLLEAHKSIWAQQTRKVIYKAIELYKEKEHFKYKSKRTKQVELELNQLLLTKLDPQKNSTEVIKLQESLIRHRETLLVFLYHKGVPPDNNSSEQAIRNAKVKMKISGGFKALQNQYAVIRSIIDTAIKNQLNILDTLCDIESGKHITF